MLLRNLCQSKTCNGTLLRITGPQKNLREVQIMTGSAKDESVFISFSLKTSFIPRLLSYIIIFYHKPITVSRVKPRRVTRYTLHDKSMHISISNHRRTKIDTATQLFSMTYLWSLTT